MFEAFIRLFCSVLDALSLDQEAVRNITDSILAMQDGMERKQIGGNDDEKVDGQNDDGL